jgi:hypothetical protein
MDHASNRPAGGDTRTPVAKADIAKREQQIVELRLRNISFTAIGRVMGISKQSAAKAFNRALYRNTDKDIQTSHRIELAKLEMEETRYWQSLDAHKDSWQAVASLAGALNRVHIRRARLLGLDAPTRLDIRGFYGTGGDEVSAERLERRRVLEALPVEEQIRLYELFEAAKKRAAGMVETTAMVVSGLHNRNAAEEPDTEHTED